MTNEPLSDYARFKLEVSAEERDRLGFAKWQQERRDKSALKELDRQQAAKARTEREQQKETP